MKTVFDCVEELYEEKRPFFSEIETVFERDFSIPRHISRDTIKRITVSAFDDGKNSFLFARQGFFKSFFTYYAVMGYLILMSIAGKRKAETIDTDVIFENWSGNSFELFYAGLYDKLKSHAKKISVFDNNREFDRSFFPRECETVHENAVHSHRFSVSASLKILKKQFRKFFLFRKLSLSSDIDMVSISLRLMRYIAVYETDMMHISSKFLISAADNYYGAMRYHIYKRDGIENIALIQNAIRTGYVGNDGGDMYAYCDYYFGFGEKTISTQKGMVCEHKIPIGSIRLYDNLLSVGNIDTSKPLYDVVFMEQLAILRNSEFNIDVYLEIIDMLCTFAEKNPDRTVAYRTRPHRREVYMKNREVFDLAKEIDSRLKKAGVIIDEEITENSYEAILRSRVVVFYTSTIGFEALGLGKRVLNCNFERYIFGMSGKNELGVLVEKDYELFEKKLKYLLDSPKSKTIENYFVKKREEFMNLNGDPSIKILDILGL